MQQALNLWEACSAGYTFDEVQIDFYRANGDKRIKYLQIKLKHVLVSSVTPTVNDEVFHTNHLV